jgi:hypothetical protein
MWNGECGMGNGRIERVKVYGGVLLQVAGLVLEWKTGPFLIADC